MEGALVAGAARLRASAVGDAGHASGAPTVLVSIVQMWLIENRPPSVPDGRAPRFAVRPGGRSRRPGDNDLVWAFNGDEPLFDLPSFPYPDDELEIA